MKLKLFLLFIFLITANLFAQNYPEVSVKDVQFVSDDSLLTAPHDYPSVYEGDTVMISGVVMNSPLEEDGVTERLHSGAPALYISDTSVDGRAWSGIIVRDVTESDVFAELDTGYVIKLPVVIGSYYTTTQANVLEFSAENVIGNVGNRPEAVPLTLDSLVVTAPGEPNYLAEKWEGVYVELRNLTVDQDYNLGNNSFGAYDENGKRIVIYTESDYWRTQSPPETGTKLDYVKGMIANRDNIPSGDWYLINPIYPDDIKLGSVVPPRISEIKRDKAEVKFGEEVNVSAKIVDPDGTIASATLVYSVNGADSVEVEMTAAAGDSVYTGTIPAQNDSTLIAFYVEATDNEDNYTSNRNAKLDDPYFYMTLNRALTIQDIQYNPFGTGGSGYSGYEVSVDGIVTADTSMLQGDGNQIGPRVHIQNGTGPWSGLVIFGTEASDVKFGNYVTATGIVNENFNVTTIGSIDDGVSITVNSENAPVPEPYEITTDMIGTMSSGTLPAESFESVLIKYNNVTVTSENADGDPGYEGNNYGEMLVADESNVSTRVELQEGNHDYHNLWDETLSNEPIRVIDDSHFDGLIGVLYFSFGNYKLVPRTNDDFINYVTGVEDGEEVKPEEYALQQNYPNPFNPSTVISYSLPENSVVKLQIFNILGQKVSTLFDGFQKAGTHKVNFNGHKLTSGIYFYRLEANNFVQTMKMMLIK